MMTSKQVVRGTFGQKGDNWFSYFRCPVGRHTLSQSSKVIGSVTPIASYMTKNELVAAVNQMGIEVAE